MKIPLLSAQESRRRIRYLKQMGCDVERHYMPGVGTIVIRNNLPPGKRVRKKR